MIQEVLGSPEESKIPSRGDDALVDPERNKLPESNGSPGTLGNNDATSTLLSL